MTALSRADLATLIATDFADNTMGAITPVDLRGGFTAVVDSAFNLQDDAGGFANLPEATKTANYSVTASDAGTMLVADDTDPITFDLPAVAASEAEVYFARNIGAGALTIDGNDAEQIEGAATLVLATGESAMIWPNAGKTALRATVWRVAPDLTGFVRHDAAQSLSDGAKVQALTNIGVEAGAEGDIFYRDGDGLLKKLAKGTAGQKIRQNAALSGPEWTSEWETIASASFSAETSISFANLGAFEALRLTLRYSLSSSANVLLRTSTDNGSTYDDGASDYIVRLFQRDDSFTSGGITGIGMYLNNNAVNSGIDVSAIATLFGFNKNVIGLYQAESYYRTSGNLPALVHLGGHRAQSTARNALRLLPTAGNFSGWYRLEGLRG